jgi:hypothetical protein
LLEESIRMPFALNCCTELRLWVLCNRISLLFALSFEAPQWHELCSHIRLLSLTYSLEIDSPVLPRMHLISFILNTVQNTICSQDFSIRCMANQLIFSLILHKRICTDQSSQVHGSTRAVHTADSIHLWSRWRTCHSPNMQVFRVSQLKPQVALESWYVGAKSTAKFIPLHSSFSCKAYNSNFLYPLLHIAIQNFSRISFDSC